VSIGGNLVSNGYFLNDELSGARFQIIKQFGVNKACKDIFLKLATLNSDINLFCSNINFTKIYGKVLANC